MLNALYLDGKKSFRAAANLKSGCVGNLENSVCRTHFWAFSIDLQTIIFFKTFC